MVLQKIVKNKIYRYNKERCSFSKGERRQFTFKNKKNGRHLCVGNIIRHNEFVVNILEGAISGKRLWEDLEYNT
jgi:hypothetical protein